RRRPPPRSRGRRLRAPRVASGWPRVRRKPGKRVRGRGAPHGPLLGVGPHGRRRAAAGMARGIARGVRDGRRVPLRAAAGAPAPGPAAYARPPPGGAVMSRVALTHVIEERFATPVTLATHWLRLRPAAHARAGVTAYSLRVRTEPHFVNWFRDAYENHVARLDFPEPVTRLAIDVDVVAEIADANPFDFLLDDDALEHPFAYEEQVLRDLAPYLHAERPGPRLARWLRDLPRGRAAVIDRVRETILAV